jgi:hypothetical protein
VEGVATGRSALDDLDVMLQLIGDTRCISTRRHSPVRLDPQLDARQGVGPRLSRGHGRQ